MVRRLLAFAILGLPIAFLADRMLARRRGGHRPAPLRMTVVVDAPIEQTWSLLADLGLQPEWMREMKELRLLTPGPTGVGTRAEAMVRIFGIAVSDPVEVTAFEPPTRYAIRHDGMFTGDGVITLEAGADGTSTTVRWEETLVPPLLPELGAILGGPILRAVFQSDLERFKRIVESGGID